MMPSSIAPRHGVAARIMNSSLVDTYHDVGGLDHRIGGLAGLELQLVYRLVGDRGCHDGPPDVDAHMGRGLTLLYGVDRPLQDVARTELHLGPRVNGVRLCRPIALYSLTT